MLKNDLNEMKAKNLSEFKVMATRMLKQLLENYKNLNDNYKELSRTTLA